MALGTDPLTGNLYLFAAANPVAYFENGYEPCAEGADCDYYYTGEGDNDSSNGSSRGGRVRAVVDDLHE